MAVLKCKMCGGTLELVPSQTVAECRYCGTPQTVPCLNTDRRTKLLDRANDLRRNSEFDKAATIYEQLLAEETVDAEVYWSLVLCRYGVEYVKDPATQAYIPTVNRTQYTSVFDDTNYKAALQHADASQRALYEQEAAAINEIQKGILAISQKEEPFDIFICYKESDGNGRRTPDSVIAQDLYYLLTKEGFKVFFARITLENKLGTAYEPYIFAALHSAKVMVVMGTCREHFEAVWVKNEWSRYLSLIRGGADKMLIPAYRDMDPYHLPEEFSHLQAQDMSKLGFMQDLVHGIRKIVGPVKQETVPAPSSTVAEDLMPLLKRVRILLEDGLFDRANELCEEVLNRDPENAWAYVYQLCVELGCNTVEALGDAEEDTLDSYSQYDRVLCYGDDQLVETVRRLNKKTHERKQQQEEMGRLRRQQQEERREAEKRRQQAEERKKELRRREEEARQKELLRKEAERQEQLRREEAERRAQLEEQRRTEKKRWKEATRPYRSRNKTWLTVHAVVQILLALATAGFFTVGLINDPTANDPETYIPVLMEVLMYAVSFVFAAVLMLPNWIASAASFLGAFTKANGLLTVISFVVCGIGCLWTVLGIVAFIMPEATDKDLYMGIGLLLVGVAHAVTALFIAVRKTRRHAMKSMG